MKVTIAPSEDPWPVLRTLGGVFSMRPCSLLVAVMLLTGCNSSSPKPTSYHLSGLTMGTTFSITIADPTQSFAVEPDLPRIADDIDKLLAEFNRQMSTYDPTSEISRFNDKQDGEPMPISPAFARVVEKALEISTKSNGRFDVTVSPLVELWGFGPKGKRHSAPSAEEIQAAKANVGADLLELSTEPPTLQKKKPGVRLDLNAIAPGYAVDLLAKFLEERGYHNYLIEIGGEFLARGNSPQNAPWHVAIEKPIPSQALKRSIARVVAVRDKAVATSGDYRNFVVYDGKTYSHTIDPVTGAPVEHSLASVTILAPDCMTADAVATAVSVLGPSEGMKLVEEWDGIEAIIFERGENGELTETQSSGAPAYIAPVSP